MEILVAGNSMAASLYLAYFEGPPAVGMDKKIAFHVVPGGTGPAFDIRDGKLVPIEGAATPFFGPADAPSRHIDEFDAIVVSALGYIDGGYAYESMSYKNGALFDFRPRQVSPEMPWISRACWREILRAELDRYAGARFVRKLRSVYSGRIIIQPMPYLSETIKTRSDWHLSRAYEDAIGMYQYLTSERDAYLRDFCEQVDAELLPYPDEAWSVEKFTPSDLITDHDGVHPLPPYGELVLRQIDALLSIDARRPDAPSKAEE